MITLPEPIVERTTLPQEVRRHVSNFIGLMNSPEGYISLKTVFPYGDGERLLGRLKGSWTVTTDSAVMFRWEFKGVLLDRPVYLYGDEEL